MPRINSGHPIPALRPEQSDHVPWADCPQGLSSSTGCPVSHSSLPVALLASHLPCGSLWAAPKAPLGPRFPSGQFAALTRREKALYCPFLKEGVRNVARRLVGELTHAIMRARAHSFPLSKRARLFPSAAYRRSAPPQLAVGRLTPCGLGWFPVGWPILEGHRPAGSAGASHEACRRMAVCTRQAAGSRTRPASREACRRAAVASRPSRMSPEHPARHRRAGAGAWQSPA